MVLAIISSDKSHSGLHSYICSFDLSLNILSQEFMTPQNCLNTTLSVREQLTDLEDYLRQNSKSSNPSFDFKANWRAWNPREDRMADLTEM